MEPKSNDITLDEDQIIEIDQHKFVAISTEYVPARVMIIRQLRP